MPEPFFDRLSSAVARVGPLCVGLDPSSALLEAWGLDDDAKGAEHLARTVLEAVAPVAAVVKPQVAFYERFGSAGYAVLERVLASASELGLVVIGDAKRGDIPSTTAGYAQAWLADASPLAVDAVTLSAYLGSAALGPAFELAHATGRGVFVVVASSNDEGRGIQTAAVPTGATVETTLLAELDAASLALGGETPSRCLGA
ncbi:MAG TPA: orotidine-5'-phosphate decarboxylase, partial [Acidimicrobiales bacterium]|nr:orotidine-5'-phosphate decarboxylase [Acidimicrobiales bacterium]